MYFYLVAYDLYKGGQDYAAVEKILREIDPDANKILRSTWLIHTSMTDEAVVALLQQAGDSNDKFGVATLSKYLPSRPATTKPMFDVSQFSGMTMFKS